MNYHVTNTNNPVDFPKVKYVHIVYVHPVENGEPNLSKVTKMKHCYIRFNEDFHVLHDNRYIEVFLCEDENGELMCGLNGCDDWELSYTGPDAEDKFNALLYVSGEVSFEYIIQLGFTQYG